MHQHTDTDDLPPAADWNLPTDFISPIFRWSNVQVVAYNPFKYIPLTRLDHIGCAHEKQNHKSSTDRPKGQHHQGIPNATQHFRVESPVSRIIFKNTAFHQRTSVKYVSRGTMTCFPEMTDINIVKNNRRRKRRVNNSKSTEELGYK